MILSLAQAKIEKMKETGADNLHIVSDFDRTLSTDKVDGVRQPTSFGHLSDEKYLGEYYTSESKRLFDIYHPIEIDLNISLEEKTKHMDIWWRLILDLLIETGLTKQIIEDILQAQPIHLRGDSKQFFHILENNNIPLLILSAGLGDIFTTHLKQKELITNNVHIISNLFDFDTGGKATKVKYPPIHTTNKNESGIMNSPYSANVEARDNVIVIGDMIEDLRMVEGLQHNTVLSIGFLNDPDSESRAKYHTAFDIVFEDEGALTPVNEIIQDIISK
jgi:cytosolic 5'-nucleotidase 3